MATEQATGKQECWDIPHGWDWLTIGEITGEEITDGKKNSKDGMVIGHSLATDKDGKGIVRVGGTIPFFSSGDLENKKEIQVTRWTTEDALNEKKISLRYRPTADRLLVALSRERTAGKVGTFKGEGIHSHSIIAIIPLQEKIYLDYLFYCFREKKISEYATNEVIGTKRTTSATKTHLRQVKVPVPSSVDEQKLIVERIETLLSDVQKGRDHLKAMKKDAERVLDRVLAEIFDDERCKQWQMRGPLQEYMHIGVEPMLSSLSLQSYGSYSSIDLDSIQEGTGQLAGIPSLQERAKPGEKSKYVLEDTQEYLLFVKPSPEKRRIAVLSHQKAVCSTSILPLSIRPAYQQDILSDFLMWELLALSLNKLTQNPFAFNVSIPSKEEQQYIIAYLEDIRSQILGIQDNLKKGEEMFDRIEQRIIQDALSGKLLR